MEKMQPEKDFNFCYSNFFKPILHIISDAVESNVSDDKNLNQTYIDIVKIISAYNDTEMAKFNQDNDTSVIGVDKIHDFCNNTSQKKGAILTKINKDIPEFLQEVYNAKAGLYHYKELYNNNITGFTMKDLTEKCLGDIEVSNFQVVRNDVCKYANFALVKLFDNSTAENNTLLIEESLSAFNEQIAVLSVLESDMLALESNEQITAVSVI